MFANPRSSNGSARRLSAASSGVTTPALTPRSKSCKSPGFIRNPAARLTAPEAWINYSFRDGCAQRLPGIDWGARTLSAAVPFVQAVLRSARRAQEQSWLLVEEVASRSHEPTRIRHPWNVLPDPRHPGGLRPPPLHHGLPVLPAPRSACAAGAAPRDAAARHGPAAALQRDVRRRPAARKRD